jgi:hypothetical protein
MYSAYGGEKIYWGEGVFFKNTLAPKKTLSPDFQVKRERGRKPSKPG